MALSDITIRKWVKPFILVLIPTLISILAYGNLVSRIENSTMVTENGEEGGGARVPKGQGITQTALYRSAATPTFSARPRKTIPKRKAPIKKVIKVPKQTAPHKSRPAKIIKIGPHHSDIWPVHRPQIDRHLWRLPHSTSDQSIPSKFSTNTREVLDVLEGGDFSKYEFEDTGDISKSILDYVMFNDTNISPPQSTKAPPSVNPSDLTELFEQIRDIKINTNFMEAQDENLGRNAIVKTADQAARGKPVVIVVLGRMRTGSTIVGEIFNQNAEVGFLYEPLHAVGDWINRRTISRMDFDSESTTLLSKLSSCQFPQNFISSVPHWPTAGGLRSSMIQPVCVVTSGCKLATSHALHQHCLKYQRYRGIKVIRADLNTLLPLVQEGSVDVKILHLIRDPRGTANSRRQVYAGDRNLIQRRLALRDYSNHMLINAHPADPLRRDPRRYPMIYSKTPYHHYFPHGSRLDITGLLNTNDVFPHFNTIPAYCKWLRSTITQVQQKPDWLHGRYKLVRYEDFAEDPLSVTKDIYHYFGMSLPDRVHHWVVNNTGGNVKGNNGLYGSHRNSSEAAFKWRTVMTAQEASQVERECGDIMERIGYLRTSDRLRLADVQRPLIRPLPDNIPNEL